MLFFIAAAVFALDRLTKSIVQRGMSLYESIPVIKGIFHITYVRNPGAAFGLLANQTLFFIVVTVVVSVVIVVYARQFTRGRRWLAVACGLQLGGALGNLYDRVATGTVVDFLDFRIWPVFNLADIALVSGVALFAYYLLATDGRGDA